MPTTLVIGATRGLGACLVSEYLTKPDNVVLATMRGARGSEPSSIPGQPSSPSNLHWIPEIDISQPTAHKTLVSGVASLGPIDTVVVNAGYFGKESFNEPDWDAEVRMYATSAIGPVFVVQALVKGGLLKQGSKVVLVTSEAGSIGLRHEKEGGGMYGHHASKAAENMVGKLLSLDLKDKGIAVVMAHPGFMRTEMTRSVGFDKYWDDGGAVTPDVAAKSLVEWIETKVSITTTGQYWAPRGPRDIGTAQATMGDNLSTPLQLPW